MKNTQDCNVSQKTYTDFVGGWGYASLTVKDFLTRCKLGYAQISESLDPYTDIRFEWIKVSCAPTKELDWVLVGYTHFDAKPERYQTYEQWNNGLHLMLHPGRIFVPALYRSQKKLFYSKKFYPSSQFTTEFYDKSWFTTAKVFQYQWSYIDMHVPVGYPKNEKMLKAINYDNKWFKDTCMKWVNRKEYDKGNVEVPGEAETSGIGSFFGNIWDSVKSQFFKQSPQQTPFNPPIYRTIRLNQAFFFYKIKLNVTGKSMMAQRVGSLPDIAPAPTECPSGKCPDSAECATSDLDSDGFIKEDSLRRIIGTNFRNQLSDTEEASQESSPFEEYSEEVTESEDPGATVHTNLPRYFRLIQKAKK